MNLREELQKFSSMAGQSISTDVVNEMEASLNRLIASGIERQTISLGQRIPDFTLPNAYGDLVSSNFLLSKGPIVLSFYRGGWCPYCNLELKALQEFLPEIIARGANLVAVSPEKPDNSLSLQEKLSLAFPVLSDARNDLARRLGLVFVLDQSIRAIYRDFGINLVESNGNDSFELPIPATYVISRNGTVLGAYVNPDYRQRLDPETILEWLDNAS
jgi:peroxiredoxin